MTRFLENKIVLMSLKIGFLFSLLWNIQYFLPLASSFIFFKIFESTQCYIYFSVFLFLPLFLQLETMEINNWGFCMFCMKGDLTIFVLGMCRQTGYHFQGMRSIFADVLQDRVMNLKKLLLHGVRIFLPQWYTLLHLLVSCPPPKGHHL